MSEASIDVAGTGFTVLDRVYSNRQKAFEALGGSCGNVLVSLALLQRKVAPVLTLGFDSAGDFLLDEFEEAGADTRFIFRSHYVSSPILAQELDVASGQHWFTFVCPETDADLPRYQPLEAIEVQQAEAAFDHCTVFYADRLSEAIVNAMETAERAGALVYFEPSAVEDARLFQRALRCTSVLKYSSERFPTAISESALAADAISIITFGAEGLEIRQKSKRVRCTAVPAQIVRDTCGSGDMVSVGIIDRILSHVDDRASWSLDLVLPGVIAGQRLASANCAYAGARGLFRNRGAEFVRSVLNGEDCDIEADWQRDLFED